MNFLCKNLNKSSTVIKMSGRDKILNPVGDGENKDQVVVSEYDYKDPMNIQLRNMGIINFVLESENSHSEPVIVTSVPTEVKLDYMNIIKTTRDEILDTLNKQITEIQNKINDLASVAIPAIPIETITKSDKELKSLKDLCENMVNKVNKVTADFDKVSAKVTAIEEAIRKNMSKKSEAKELFKNNG